MPTGQLGKAEDNQHAPLLGARREGTVETNRAQVVPTTLSTDAFPNEPQLVQADFSAKPPLMICM
ncbi:hypothetical protein H2200_008965 [Cladophialophora chaetospira]|uniref:Uncharacterized protein n=1 Tax=Cladophialophora chaetospira TaxID=386627 RepID=A0AA39CG30_9EURO|nr:hypothetical protein H2200_008965 [Cladophialophora chaetospira]